MTDREIMQQALRVLYDSVSDREGWCKQVERVVAKLEHALAQPEQAAVKQEHTEWGGDCVAGHCPFPAGCEFSNCCRMDTQPPAKIKQEPVARFNWNEAKFEWLTEYSFDKHHMKPLYLAPPRKEWVGLTDDERNEMIGRIQHDQYTRQLDLIGSTQIITEMYLKGRNT